jgi:branched-chain amino acid transport system permease protein
VSTVVLLTITGLGLGAMYFLIASGLSLIYGLMGVLNFAHGSFITVGAYAMWFTESKLGGVSIAPRLFDRSTVVTSIKFSSPSAWRWP